MTERYVWGEDDGMLVLTETLSKRTMIMHSSDGEISFKFPAWEDEWRKLPFVVTARNLQEYNEAVGKLDLDPRKRYCEVGPGFGEFIPNLVRRFNGLEHYKPAVIEPMDYGPFIQQMKYALRDEKLVYEAKIRDRIKTLITRATILKDPRRVDRIGLKLQDALKQIPGLKGTMDVVVDNCAAYWYTAESLPPEKRDKIDFDILRREVLDLERSLLKPNGSLIVEKL